MNKALWISLVVFFLVYGGILGSATYDDIFYQWDLNRYDLDKDGFFGGAEINSAQEEASSKLSNDIGRNASCITGLIFATILSLMINFLVRIISVLKKN